MRILILGATGMLGYQALKTCLKRRIDVHGVVRSTKLLEGHLDKSALKRVYELEDIRRIDRLEAIVQTVKPHHVINCVGIVKQSDLANDYIESITLNALLPHQLQLLGQRNDFKLIHISTDCVFNGKKGRYKEADQSDAYDLYGKSKHLGEVDYGNAITLRTSIIGHEISRNTHGLIEWFLSQEGPVRGFNKAVFSGFTTLELTNIILDYVIPKNLPSGLYQVAAAPINKYELLTLVSKVYKKDIRIEPSDELIIDRSLDGSKFENMVSYKPPTWHSLITKMKNDYKDSFSKI